MISMGFLPKMYFFNLLQHITCKLKYFEHEFYEFVFFFLNAQKCGNYPTVPPHSGRNNTFLCIFEKNIFLDILDDSKNILENGFFDQTSS